MESSERAAGHRSCLNDLRRMLRLTPPSEMHLKDGDEPGGANDGFHRTDTTDFGVLLSGNMALELDDGAEVVLSPGDVLIENGTRHRWRVVGDVPATLASFIIGARRDLVPACA